MLTRRMIGIIKNDKSHKSENDNADEIRNIVVRNIIGT